MGKKTYYHDPVLFAVNKPAGPSSTAVVGAIKKILAKDANPHRKIGHFGTLDPFAEGLLLVGANGATKLTNYLHADLTKTYRARGVFGQQTPTGDYTSLESETEREIPTSSELRDKGRRELEELFHEKFVGEYWQRPQTYSAAKHRGKALYQWAREGNPVEKAPVRREIFSLEIEEFSYPYMTFIVRVSSGTYIRRLFEDMAACFRIGGYLQDLKRLAIGEFSLAGGLDLTWEKDSQKFGQVDRDELDQVKYRPDQVLNYPHRRVGLARARDFCHGRELFSEELGPYFGQCVWIVGDMEKGERLLGLAKRGESSDTPLIVFPAPQRDLVNDLS